MPRRLPLAPEGALPPLYDAWMRDALGGPVPPEPHATCSDCAMVAPPGADSGASFDPRVKCCTHDPFLPSFLVGRVLEDRAVPARVKAAIRARIAGQAGVSPLGLFSPRPRALAEGLAGEHDQFGRVGELLCGFYVEAGGGRCGIHAHRNAVCTTFYCKHERGAVSAAFWRGALEPLLKEIERSLALHVLVELDFPEDSLARIMAAHKELRGAELAPDEGRRRLDFGPWAGREEELFLVAAAKVAPLSWGDVRRVGGAAVEARARVARAALARVRDRALPRRLRAAPLSTVQPLRDASRIVTYSPYDPLDLPRAWLTAVGRFDGRPTRVVLREIAKKDGLELDEDALHLLLDFEILQAAPT